MGWNAPLDLGLPTELGFKVFQNAPFYTTYNPNKNSISSHLEALRRSLDIYSALYENTVLIGDFNVDVNDPIMGFSVNRTTLKV